MDLSINKKKTCRTRAGSIIVKTSRPKTRSTISCGTISRPLTTHLPRTQEQNVTPESTCVLLSALTADQGEPKTRHRSECDHGLEGYRRRSPPMPKPSPRPAVSKSQEEPSYHFVGVSRESQGAGALSCFFVSSALSRSQRGLKLDT